MVSVGEPALEAPPSRSRGLGRRVGWGLADQSLSSLTNFATNIIAAATLSRSDFGAFSVAFLGFTLALNASRAVASEPFVIRFSNDSGKLRDQPTRAATGAAVVVGATISIPLLVTARFISHGPALTLAVLALTLPALLLQDTWRFVFFARSVGSKAFANDLVWAIALFPALAVLLVSHRVSAPSVLFVWAAAATVASLYGIRQSKIIPHPGLAPSWWLEQRDLAGRYLLEFLAMTTALPLSLFVIGVIGGLEALGTLRAGFILYGPLNILFLGLGLIGVPQGVALLRRSVGHLFRGALQLTATFVGCTLAWGFVLILLPPDIGRKVLPSAWEALRPISIPLLVLVLGMAALHGAYIGLRTLQAAYRSLRVQFIAVPMKIVGAAIGAETGGLVGATVALAVAQCLEAALVWREFVGACRERVHTQTLDLRP